MARPKTEFRNEVKSRLPDHIYEGLKSFQADNDIPSESRAISQLLGLALFGAVGIVPQSLLNCGHEMAQSGKRISV